MIHDTCTMHTRYVNDNTIHLHDMQQKLQAHYDAELLSGSEGSTASTQAAMLTWGRATRLGLQADPPRRPRPRGDAYTQGLEQELLAVRQERDEDRQRLASLEEQMQQMQQALARFCGGGVSGGGGSSSGVGGGSSSGGGGDDPADEEAGYEADDLS
jgi:hypothetical protein